MIRPIPSSVYGTLSQEDKAQIKTVADNVDDILTTKESIPLMANIVAHMGNLNFIAGNQDAILSVANNVNAILKYLGTESTDPTERLNGDALEDGDYYFNDNENRQKYYDTANLTWLSNDSAQYISADENNQIKLGTDNRLLVNSADLLDYNDTSLSLTFTNIINNVG